MHEDKHQQDSATSVLPSAASRDPLGAQFSSVCSLEEPWGCTNLYRLIIAPHETFCQWASQETRTPQSVPPPALRALSRMPGLC